MSTVVHPTWAAHGLDSLAANLSEVRRPAGSDRDVVAAIKDGA